MCHQTQSVYNDLLLRIFCRKRFSKTWSKKFSANQSNPYNFVSTVADMNKPKRHIQFFHAVDE